MNSWSNLVIFSGLPGGEGKESADSGETSPEGKT